LKLIAVWVGGEIVNPAKMGISKKLLKWQGYLEKN